MFAFVCIGKMILKEFFMLIHESSASESLAKLIKMWRLVCVCVCVYVCVSVCVFMLSHFSHSDSVTPSSSVHGILHTRILKRVAIFSSRGSSQPKD